VVDTYWLNPHLGVGGTNVDLGLI